MAISRCLAVICIASLANEIDAYTNKWVAKIKNSKGNWETFTWVEEDSSRQANSYYVRGKKIWDSRTEPLDDTVASFKDFFEFAKGKGYDTKLEIHMTCVLKVLATCGNKCRFESMPSTSSYYKGYVGQSAAAATWIPYKSPNAARNEAQDKALGRTDGVYKWFKGGRCADEATCELNTKYNLKYSEWDRTLRPTNTRIILVPTGHLPHEQCINGDGCPDGVLVDGKCHDTKDIPEESIFTIKGDSETTCPTRHYYKKGYRNRNFQGKGNAWYLRISDMKEKEHTVGCNEGGEFTSLLGAIEASPYGFKINNNDGHKVRIFYKGRERSSCGSSADYVFDGDGCVEKPRPVMQKVEKKIKKNLGASKNKKINLERKYILCTNETISENIKIEKWMILRYNENRSTVKVEPKCFNADGRTRILIGARSRKDFFMFISGTQSQNSIGEVSSEIELKCSQNTNAEVKANGHFEERPGSCEPRFTGVRTVSLEWPYPLMVYCDSERKFYEKKVGHVNYLYISSIDTDVATFAGNPEDSTDTYIGQAYVPDDPIHHIQVENDPTWELMGPQDLFPKTGCGVMKAE